MPRVITGQLASQNKNAIDWGWTGYVAFGVQSFVVVVHPGQAELIQTLDGHSCHVIKVRWSRENYPHEIRGIASRKDSDARNLCRLRLASADSSGNVIVWDVLKASQISSFNEPGKSVSEMFWLPWQDASNDLLLVLHSPNVLVLWNADQATKVWKKTYSDSLTTFSLDPFQFSNAAFLTSSGNVMLIDDFSFSKTPAGNGQQFKVSTSSSTGVTQDEEGFDAKRPSLVTTFIKRPLIKVLATAVDRGGRILEGSENSPVSNMISTGGPTSPPMAVGTPIVAEEPSAQLCYHPSVRNVLFLVYPREIVVLDSHNVQTITQIVFDRSASPLLRVIPCSLRDAVYFVQENGAISFRIQKFKSSTLSRSTVVDALDVFNPLDVVYELACSSETLRVTKANRAAGVALCPWSQRRLLLLLFSGKLLSYELTSANGEGGKLSNLYVLSDLVKLTTDLRQETVAKLRFCNFGALSSLNGAPLVVRACPSPSGPGRQICAIGTADGYVQIVDVGSGRLERDFAVHSSCPVKCLEWCGPNYVISSAYKQTLSTSTVVRNELILTDVRNGLTRPIRPECDESPIELLRVSHFCCFLAVAFRDQPMEIWDLKAFRLLRRMSKTCPIIVDIAWSTKHNQSQAAISAVETTSGDAPTLVGAENVQQESVPKSLQHTVYRENLVVLDNDSHLYHVVVKGIHVRDGKEVNTQRAGNSIVTAMAWKEDVLVFGYADGRLSVWNLDAKQCRTSSAQRGVVKRVQFSKQPTDLTFIVLHADGAAVWNAAKFTMMYQLNSFRDFPQRIIDVDLAGDENIPLLVTADGCLRVFDQSLSRQSQSVETIGSPTVFSSCSISQSLISLTKIILSDNRVIHSYSNLDFELVSSPKMPSGETAPVTADDYYSAIQKCEISDSEKSVIIRHLSLLEENDALTELGRSPTTVHRALAVCRLLGDEWGVNFWTLVLGVVPSAAGCSSFSVPTNFDLFWDNENFYKLQIQRCSTFDSKRCTPEQLKAYVETLILLGKFEAAAQVLLNTESGRADYYADCLKACLLSASHETPACQSTIKLAATNLIADGKLSEGVELLRIIGKNLDACRYLQSFSCWEKAAWLAKVSLPADDYREILRRWVDALCGPQLSKKTFAVLLLISLRQFDKLLELLVSMKQIFTAALFMDYILTRNNNLVEDDIAATSSSSDSDNRSRLSSVNIDPNLSDHIYVEYARLLFAVGLRQAAFAYCRKAGDRGVQVAKELEILSSDDK